VAADPFAIAYDVTDRGYTALRHGKEIIDIYPSDYLVKIAQAIKEEERQKKEREIVKSAENVNNGTYIAAAPAATPEPAVKVPAEAAQEPAPDRKFYMRVTLDNIRANRELQNYLTEIIPHLSAVDNCEVELSFEVNAYAPDGFPHTTVRTVSENCRTLKVEDFGFKK
jgi:hypothetical protein